MIRRATSVLEAKPGERVRIYFVNANINLPVALHPIASIWDRVYINGNPKNTLVRNSDLQRGCG